MPLAAASPGEQIDGLPACYTRKQSANYYATLMPDIKHQLCDFFNWITARFPQTTSQLQVAQNTLLTHTRKLEINSVTSWNELTHGLYPQTISLLQVALSTLYSLIPES